MGSDNGEDDEKPAHQVAISNSYYLSKYEVTQAQWRQVMGSNPSAFHNCGSDCPVESVSWRTHKIRSNAKPIERQLRLSPAD